MRRTLDASLPDQQGYYGVSVTVKGAAGGFPFERTLVRSAAVIDLATLSGDPWQLDQLLQP